MAPPASGQLIVPERIVTPLEWIDGHAEELLAEWWRRRFGDALRLYRALPEALPFHRSNAYIRILVGSNQCLSGSELIYDPVARRHRRLDGIDGEFYVHSVDPATGKRIVARANKPFRKGRAHLFRITLSSGEFFDATLEHVVLGTPQSGWLRIRDAWQLLRRYGRCHLRSSAESDLGSFERDVPHCSQTTQGFQGGYPSLRCSCGEQPPAGSKASLCAAPSQGGAQVRIYHTLRGGGSAYTQGCNRSYQSPFRHSNQGVRPLASVRAGASESRVFWPLYAPGSGVFQGDDRFRLRLAHPSRTRFASALSANLFAADEMSPRLGEDDKLSSPRTCREYDQSLVGLYQHRRGQPQRSRQLQAHLFSVPSASSSVSDELSIVDIRPLFNGAYYDFEVPETGNYVHKNAVHHNSGKTGGTCSEVARIVRGRHPLFPKTNGKALCVGGDQSHIAQNMWQKLALPVCFQIVPDEIDGHPRAVRPDPRNPHRAIDPIDEARKALWVWAPPFLPAEEIEKIAWDEKATGCPKYVRLKNGWEMLWHPSGGRPRKGIEIDLAWLDEDIEQSEWFYEVLPRLLRRGGRILWSATPQANNIELLKLHRQFEAGDPDVFEVNLKLEHNPYIPEDAKAKMHKQLSATSLQDLKVRYYGEWEVLSRQVYTEWSMNTLGVDGFNAA